MSIKEPACVLFLRHQVWLFIITHSRCERLWEERWRPRSSIPSIWVLSDPNGLLKVLDLSHASDRPKDRQTGYYTFKATGNLWNPLETVGVSKLTEWVFQKAFRQNNVAQVCSSSPKLALKSVITSRVFRADIIPRIRETQKNDNKWQYSSAEIRCREGTVLWALQDQGNMPFWNQCQHLSLNEACCHAAEHTVLVVWQGVIINGDGGR